VKTYDDALREAWAEHLLPKGADAPTVVSLFAGCGGSSLGYSMAGFFERLAVDFDENARATFESNFSGVPFFGDDIANLSVEEALELAGLAPGELDVLDGSPPCQGFSTAGSREMFDSRNQLFLHFVRLLRGYNPRAFVMENVSGLVKGKMRLIFAEILRELRESGYIVTARLMNAAYFDVPQSRERIIFVGVRSDLGVGPSHPRPETRRRTLREALPYGEPEPPTPETSIEKFAIGREYDRLERGESSERYFSLVRPSLDRPCPTIQSSHGALGMAGVCHPTEKRKFTIRELGRICSFPEEFVTVGTFAERWARIGNAVPPLLMRAIARNLRTEILDRAKEGAR
jgi:DNA (cytosine-5)-methyltransferase 1